MKKFLAAVRSGEPERIQGVINTDFGECFKVGGDAPEWVSVLDRKRGYQQGQIPEGVNVLTAGIDVQKNRLVYVIRGWGKNYESWLIEYGELWGETDQPAVWQSLSELLFRQWQGLSLSRVAIDSGYQTQAVYQFCRQHKHIALATKGHDTLDKPFKKSDIDVNVCGKIVKHSLQLWHFNTDQMKSWVHSRIEWPCDQSGGWWLPQDISDEYCKQLVAEQRSVKPSGKVVWVKVKQHNHFLDAESLAYLAVRIVSAGNTNMLEGVTPITRKSRRMISKGVTI